MPSEPDDRSSLGLEQPEKGVRHVQGDGLIWTVREVAAPSFDRRGGTHLIFESPEVMRRVRTFPSDWRTLSNDALYALSLTLRLDQNPG